jgi:hypothetical protein
MDSVMSVLRCAAGRAGGLQGHLENVHAADQPVDRVDDAALVDEDVVDLDGAGARAGGAAGT